jgi:hypothetical protein
LKDQPSSRDFVGALNGVRQPVENPIGKALVAIRNYLANMLKNGSVTLVVEY